MKQLFITVIFAILVIIGCSLQPSPQKSKIRIKGSDTMRILMAKLAEEYMKKNPDISIYTEGGGTGSGIKSLIDGEIDICSASRPLKPTEVSQLAERYQRIGVSSIIAKDALSIYVHPSNPIKDLTLKQLKQIFTGEIIDWLTIGGWDQEIEVIIRPPNSGTYLYFKEHILEGEPYTEKAITLPTTQQIVDEVLNNSAAIGYGGIAYGPPETYCQVNGIPPSKENVRYDLYPISRYLYLYTIRKPQGIRQEFIDWVLSPEGQMIVKQTGYIPLWSLE